MAANNAITPSTRSRIRSLTPLQSLAYPPAEGRLAKAGRAAIVR